MNNTLNTQKNRSMQRGFSIVETVIYFSILVMISVLVIGNVITLFKNYNIVRANQEIEYNAINIIDKLTRDVRDAQSVGVADSSFGIPLGAVSLTIASSTNDAYTNTVKFYSSGGKIKYMKDGVDLGNLSTNAVTVSNFKLYYITSSSTEAIKIELNLEVTPHLSSSTISKNFYSTIQLRE